MRTLNLTGAGEDRDVISWSAMRFPDGQPHIKINGWRGSGGALGGLLGDPGYDRRVRIDCRIASGDDLLMVLLAADALRHAGFDELHLHVRYLLGGRMDRPIDDDIAVHQPFTLAVVAGVLNNAGFASVTLLDPHSDVSTALLRAKAVLPTQGVAQALSSFGFTGHAANGVGRDQVILVAPDAGASKRVRKIAQVFGLQVIQALKHRDTVTGRLSGFQLVNPEAADGKVCLIVDDICDGGGTFVPLGANLKEAGATLVALFVTHGIFSRGWIIENIDRIFTTNSYRPFPADAPQHVTCVPAA